VKTGLVPTLISALTRHAALAQEAADAAAMSVAVAYLARCKTKMRELVGLVESGKLPEAVEKCHEVEGLLGEHVPSLQGTEVYVDLQVRLQGIRPYYWVMLTSLSSGGSEL
jgi:protein transport protein DSL1/ZW10